MTYSLITVISFDYPPNDGGAARLAAEVAQGLAVDNDVRVVTQRRGRSGSNVPALSETRLTPQRPWRELAAWWELVRHDRSAVVVAGIWYPDGLLALLAGRRVAILAHGSELMPPRATWRRKLWAQLQRLVLSQARIVIANSQYTANLARKSAPKSLVMPVPLAVDHERFSLGNRLAARRKFNVDAPNRLVLLSVSRLHRYKGHDTVFRALAALPPNTREQFVYLIAGSGPDSDQLRQEAAALGLADIVRWLGFVSEDDLPDLYRASDLFVLCTRKNAAQQEVEGFGLVFLEAQACGVPVVGTRTGGIPDAIHEGDGGWLIEEDDADALARILATGAADPSVFQQAGSAARARVERSCTWDHYMKEFNAVLTEAGLNRG